MVFITQTIPTIKNIRKCVDNKNGKNIYNNTVSYFNFSINNLK